MTDHTKFSGVGNFLKEEMLVWGWGTKWGGLNWGGTQIIFGRYVPPGFSNVESLGTDFFGLKLRSWSWIFVKMCLRSSNLAKIELKNLCLFSKTFKQVSGAEDGLQIVGLRSLGTGGL